jgi:TolB protein
MSQLSKFKWRIIIISLLITTALFNHKSNITQAENAGGSTIFLPVVNRSLESLNMLAFATNEANDFFEIYKMNQNGTGKTRLTFRPTTNDYFPAWSPDGTKIAFASYNSDFTASTIYIMNADGSGLFHLTPFPGYHEMPAWSPDGSKIAFASDLVNPVLGYPSDIFVMNSNGVGTPVNLTNSPTLNELFPDWSSDGTRIAYYRRDITTSQPVFHGPDFTISPNRFDEMAQNNLLVSDGEIYVMNANGTNKVNLTNHPDWDYAPKWSPFDDKIVFYRYVNSQNREIFVMNADGSAQTNLSNNSGMDFYPSWSPSGLQVAFQTYYNGWTDLYIINANGSGFFNLTNTPNFAEITVDWH